MNRLVGLAIALSAYARTRWRERRLKSRADVEKLQRRNLRRFWRRALPHVDFYAPWRGTPVALEELPIVDKAIVMGAFERFNRPRIDAAAGWRAFAGPRKIGRYIVGASTGTSGNRGLFVISEAERFKWLGIMLAKALPGFWRERHRVAVILPLATSLYESANETRLLKLRFFDLLAGPECWVETLQDFDPTVVVAPPRVLAWLAVHAPRLAPGKIFSAAETLDPPDRALIEARFNVTLGQIYMATEGLLAVTCRLGQLHLAEDFVHFEFLPAGENLANPLVTDTIRRSQVMARYRMNDLLRLSDRPCACGSPLQAVDEIVGRADDCFRLSGPGAEILVTPDVLRNAILDADRRITDFRLQLRRNEILLLTPPELDPNAAEAARAAVEALLRARGASILVRGEQALLPFDSTRKRRRVEAM